MESFFNKILCDLAGHKETRDTENLYSLIESKGLKFDADVFIRAHNICYDELKIHPSAVVKCERCGKILKNGPESFIQVYKYL